MSHATAALSFDELTSNNDRGEALKDVIETNLSEMFGENINILQAKYFVKQIRKDFFLPPPRCVVVNYRPPTSHGLSPYPCNFSLLPALSSLQFSEGKLLLSLTISSTCALSELNNFSDE